LSKLYQRDKKLTDLENITCIVKGCIEKDRKCQKTIYEHFRGYAFKIVFRYIYRYEQAIDVVNDGFVKMFNHFDTFKMSDDADNEKILMAWMKKIMINVSIDQLRKGDMLPGIDGISEEVWQVKDNNHNAEQLMLYNDLVAMIKELPANYRIVFNLYVIDGYTHLEIAHMTKTTVGTSKSHLARARAILQKRIRKMEDSLLCRI
jgi:RNA polymerase sigma factor (sigma-70 family)